MENHRCSWVNQLFQWPFSIAEGDQMTRGSSPVLAAPPLFPPLGFPLASCTRRWRSDMDMGCLSWQKHGSFMSSRLLQSHTSCGSKPKIHKLFTSWYTDVVSPPKKKTRAYLWSKSYTHVAKLWYKQQIFVAASHVTIWSYGGLHTWWYP